MSNSCVTQGRTRVCGEAYTEYTAAENPRRTQRGAKRAISGWTLANNPNTTGHWRQKTGTTPLGHRVENYTIRGNILYGKAIDLSRTASTLEDCRRGHVDWVLKKYFTITGVDISPNMLKNARKLNPQAKYIRGDMRTVRLKKQFDAVVLHDSVNYMLTRNDLKAVFKTAYLHLKPGGILWTCIEEYDKIQQGKTKFSINKKGKTEITFIENYYDPNPLDTSFEVTFVYLVRKGGKLKIYTDFHFCGIFKLETWLNLLRQTGFGVKQLRFEHSTFVKGEYMPMFVCTKPSQ